LILNENKGDEIVGVSVCCREKDDIIQIWNLDSKLESQATVCKKLQDLLPAVNFPVKFYKRKFFLLVCGVKVL
jgi:hypothetical protein